METCLSIEFHECLIYNWDWKRWKTKSGTTALCSDDSKRNQVLRQRANGFQTKYRLID